MKREDQRKSTRVNLKRDNDYIEPTPYLHRRKLKKRPKLTISEQVAIAHRVFIDKEYQKDVAREFRVSHPWVSRICSRLTKNKEAMEELLSRRECKETKNSACVRVLEGMLQRDAVIDSCEQVKHLVKHETG